MFVNLLMHVVCGYCFAGVVGFADSIVLLGLWVLIMVDGHWVFEICWVDGKAFFFFFFFLFLLFFFLRKSLFFNFFLLLLRI